MLESTGNGCLEMELQRGKDCLEMELLKGKKYIIEKIDEGKWLFLACESDQMVTPPVVRNRTPLAEYAERWLNTAKNNIKESSYMKYWNLMYSYIIPELGMLEWEGLNRETVELYVSRLRTSGGRKQKGLSAKTVSDVMSVLRQIARYASDHGAVLPFDLSSITVKKEEAEMRILSGKQQETLSRFLQEKIENDFDCRDLGVLLAMYTGMRLGEVCALRWEDISFSEQAVFVHRTMQRIQTKDDPLRKTKIIITTPKSRSSTRWIPLPEELLQILARYRKGKTGYLLTGCEGSYVEPRSMERYFQKILKEAGLEKINFHVLRHTFATRCVEQRFDTKSLSVILGHSNVNITLNRYVHPTMEMKRNDMQKLSVLLAVG